MEVVILPAEVTSPGAARQMVRRVLAGCDPDVLEAAVLLTSELVGNVVRHARSEVRVTVVPGPPIRVEVHDHAAATEAFRRVVSARPAAVPATATGGRGLGLVHDLASRVGLDDDPGGGKVVWFELDPVDV